MASNLESEFEAWKERLCNSPEEGDRCEAAELPPNVEPEKVVPVLIEALNDPHELVRLCAAEALGNYPGKKTRHALKLFIDRELDEDAKGYGLSSLGLLAEYEDIEFIMEQLKESNSPGLIIHSVVALCSAARRTAKYKLLSFTQHENPTIRAAAANGLTWVYSSTDEDVIEILQKQIQLEPERGIKIDMQNALRELIKNKAEDMS